MRQKIVPTSPMSEIRQEKDKKKKQNSNSHPHLVFATTVIALLLGSISGFFGFLITANLPTDLPIIGQFNALSVLEEQRQNILLSTRKSENSVIQQAPSIINQIVTIHSSAPTLDNFDTFLGDAVMVTSDGWMIMESSLVPDLDSKPIVVLADESIAKIEQAITDPLTGVTFIKVSVNNHEVVNIDVQNDIYIGRTLSVIEKQVGSYVVYERRVAGLSDTDSGVRTTQALSQRMMLDLESDSHQLGSSVFFSNGDFAGILLADGVIANSKVLSGALKSIIENGTIERSDVNLEYINVDYLTDEERLKHKLPDSGLYIVKATGVSGENTLNTGDVITSINNEFVQQYTDLASILHSRPGQTVFYITVMRDGQEVFIEFES